MFEHVDAPTRAVAIQRLGAPLTAALRGLSCDPATMTPPPALIMRALALCSIANTRVVILGQDPYPTAGEAMGLCFSTPRVNPVTGRPVTPPPSLRNIYQCLVECGLMRVAPTHGDLTAWAKQGVLMLNCALTTLIGRPNAHATIWQPYTDELIKEISMVSAHRLVFILLGKFAQAKASLIQPRHTVLSWGHPSPQNPANRSTADPGHFIHCTVFTEANRVLRENGTAEINWDPDTGTVPAGMVLAGMALPLTVPLTSAITPAAPTITVRPLRDEDPIPQHVDTVWIFPDGAARANGRERCRASYAFHITNEHECATVGGLVPLVDIPGKVYKTSNNRGELMGIIEGLHAATTCSAFASGAIKVVSDSEYGINAINVHGERWIAQHEDKMNMDMIAPAVALLAAIRATRTVEFIHRPGHQPEPADRDSYEWFLWRGNDIADAYCTGLLQ